MQYIECSKQLPPDGEEVHAKIDDANGCRNEATLYRQGNLWYVPDGSMYVYYRPTHWAPMTTDEKRASLQKQLAPHKAKVEEINAKLARL